MRSTTYLFVVTALAEGTAGLAPPAIPSVAISLVFGVDQPSLEAFVVGRLGGAGVLAIGVAR